MNSSKPMQGSHASQRYNWGYIYARDQGIYLFVKLMPGLDSQPIMLANSRLLPAQGDRGAFGVMTEHKHCAIQRTDGMHRVSRTR